jgi:hypothetical protein
MPFAKTHLSAKILCNILLPKFYCKIFFITSIICGTCLSSRNLVEIHASLNFFCLY